MPLSGEVVRVRSAGAKPR